MRAEPPMYRLLGSERQGFLVDLWLPDDPSKTYDPDPWYRDIETREIAHTTTRDAAMAVLRLVEAPCFLDWARPQASWDMPVTPMPSNGTPKDGE